MRTYDYISIQADRIKSGEGARGKCASVFGEGDCVYSYGYHYPLLFKVVTPSGKELLACNNRGYSVTTSKHIGWCSGHDLCVEFTHRFNNYDHQQNYQNVLSSLQVQLETLDSKMFSKKRQNTWVYQSLVNQRQTVINAINLLTDHD